MTNGNGDSGPSSWRDVYALVRDTRADILEEVAKLATQLTDHSSRIETLEGERANRASVRGAVRVSVQNGRTLLLTVVAIAAFLLSLLK